MRKNKLYNGFSFQMLRTIGSVFIPLGIAFYGIFDFEFLSMGSVFIASGITINAWVNHSINWYQKELERYKNLLTIKENDLDRIKSDNNRKLIKKEDELKSMTAQNNAMYEDAFTNIYDFFNMYLYNIVSNELSGIITPEERITIYTHDETMNVFRQIGRFSPNPKYTKRSKRKTYPENQGSIGKAWENGKCEIALRSDPTIDLKAWEMELRQDHNFEKDEVIKNISMKSRLFIGYAIENNSKNKVGVILFEGLKLERLSNSKDRLKEVFEEKHSLLSTMLIKERALRKIFPIDDPDLNK